MKIALINDQPLHSGMGKYALKLFEHLKNKYALDLLYLNYQKRTLEIHNGKIIAQGSKFPILDNKPFFWFRMRKEIPVYDIYHFANQNLSFLIFQKNTIITCHDIAPLVIYSGSFERLFRRYLYQGLKKARLIIADSFSTKKDLKRIYNIDEKKIHVVYLGVDTTIFKPLNNKLELRKQLGLDLNKKLIINVGTEKQRKNIEGLLYAFSFLVKDDDNTLLVRVGKQKKSIKKLIDKLGLCDKVIYFEDVSEQNLPFFYNAADLFVMPSFYEGFGLPAIEAMSCGIPVIVANTSSLPEIVADAAIKIHPYSIIEMFDMMKKILNEPNLQKELKEKGIQQAKKFSWHKTAEQTEQIYRNLSTI